MTESKPEQILETRLPKENLDFLAIMNKVRNAHQRGFYSQAFEILRLAFGKNKLHPSDYYAFGLYRPKLGAEEKRQFVSFRSNLAINKRLTPPELKTHIKLLDDKLLCGQLLKSCGFPVTQNKAVYSKTQSFGFLKTLSSAKEIRAFITTAKNLPLFAKPIHSSRALGVASILSCSADKSEVTLGDGRQVNAQALADEIVTHYGSGYLFQEPLMPPKKVESIIGKTAATLRIVTLQTENGPQIMYAAWRLPDHGLMHDGARTKNTHVAFVDVSTGKIDQVNRWKSYYDNTESALIGVIIPGWDVCKTMVKDAHQLFPDHGVLGWDLIITTRGPVINEVNTNPLHMIYQRAANRGFLNADNQILLDQAISEVQRKLAMHKAESKVRVGFGLYRRA